MPQVSPARFVPTVSQQMRLQHVLGNDPNDTKSDVAEDRAGTETGIAGLDPETTIHSASSDASHNDRLAFDLAVEKPETAPQPFMGTHAEKQLKADPLYRIARSQNKASQTEKLENFAYGNHQMRRHLVKGGMGQVYVAYDHFLQREVALKELFPQATMDESIVRRFLVEAAITAKLELPGIVPIHSLGLDFNGNPYYTMKLIHGITFLDAIKQYHKDKSRAELKRLVRCFVVVCKTMAIVHKKGIIHRDLKPANVMLGEHGETLLMDWGIAKFLSDVHKPTHSLPPSEGVVRYDDCPDLTTAGAIVGTPAFMAPEQAEPGGPNVGPRSDIYCLGGMLYFLLTGRNAFASRTARETLQKLRTENVPRPSNFCKDIPPGLEAICLKAMQRNPDFRYQTVEELVADVCNWLDGEAISVYEDPWQERVVRWIRKNRLSSPVLAGVGAVLVGLFLGGVLIGTQFRRTGSTTPLSIPAEVSSYWTEQMRTAAAEQRNIQARINRLTELVSKETDPEKFVPFRHELETEQLRLKEADKKLHLLETTVHTLFPRR